jgi:hypothetical protein
MDRVMSIMGEWYHIPTTLTFMFMMLSPTKFFKSVDQLVLREPDEENCITHNFYTETFAKGDSMEEIERDEKILNNLTKMLESSTNTDAKQMWMIKKSEFERALRWKRHMYYEV